MLHFGARIAKKKSTRRKYPLYGISHKLVQVLIYMNTAQFVSRFNFQSEEIVIFREHQTIYF